MYVNYSRPHHRIKMCFARSETDWSSNELRNRNKYYTMWISVFDNALKKMVISALVSETPLYRWVFLWLLVIFRVVAVGFCVFFF